MKTAFDKERRERTEGGPAVRRSILSSEPACLFEEKEIVARNAPAVRFRAKGRGDFLFFSADGPASTDRGSDITIGKKNVPGGGWLAGRPRAITAARGAGRVRGWTVAPTCYRVGAGRLVQRPKGRAL